jgi:hypothetical protein
MLTASDMGEIVLLELVDYKYEHGDCLVPQNMALGIWVNNQSLLK